MKIAVGNVLINSLFFMPKEKYVIVGNKTCFYNFGCDVLRIQVVSKIKL